jgi:hypothetical protein
MLARARRASTAIVGDVVAISRLAKLERHVVGRGAADHELSEVDCAMVEITYRYDIL